MDISINQLGLSYINRAESDIWNQSQIFESGKNYRIYAPSGSGKSSFFKLITKEIEANTGSIFFDKNNINSLDQSRIRCQYISIIFQELELIDDITALENVMLRADLFNIQVSEVEEMFKALDIKALMNQASHLLSRGEKQRVAIIRALIGDFKFLLLDEAFSHLDESSRLLAIQLIQSQQASKQFAVIHANVAEDDYFDYHKVFNL